MLDLDELIDGEDQHKHKLKYFVNFYLHAQHDCHGRTIGPRTQLLKINFSQRQ